MKRLTLKLFAGVFVIVVCGTMIVWGQDRRAEDLRVLVPGKPIERQMGPNETHEYIVRLEAGEFLRAVIEQRGIDVVVSIFAPDGTRVRDIDSPNGTEGPEPIELAASATGDYRIEVRPIDPNARPGKYEARIEEILSADKYRAFLEIRNKEREETKEWLQKNAIRLKTVQAGSGFADMEPLKTLIGDARIVCLGEATHGTREFFQLKHRMIEFLVTSMGFTVFGIEETMPEAFDVNSYVLNGIGDPEKALAGMYFWIYDTEEVLDMIQWMRAYNADSAHTRKVKFYGFDMQYGARAARVTRDYLRQVDPMQTPASDSLLLVMSDPVYLQHYSRLSDDRKKEIIGSIKSILQRFREHKTKYINRSTGNAWAIACQHANILVQYLDNWTLSGGSFPVRDSSMAENIRWILNSEGPESKMVVWAHNGHVATSSYKGVDNMGSYLRKMYGSKMVTFGLTFNQGQFQAIDLDTGGQRAFTVRGAAEGSFDSTLAAAGLSVAAIDLRKLPKEGAVARFFGQPLLTQSIGAGLADRLASSLASVVFPELYDAVLFVEKTSASRPLPAGRRFASVQLSHPSNLDLERVTPAGQPEDWTIPAELSSFDFQVSSCNQNPHSGKYSVLVQRNPGRHYGESAATMSQRVDATGYRGKKVKIRMAAEVEGIGDVSKAYLWLQVVTNGKGPRREGFHVNSDDCAIHADQWQEYQVSADVPPDADFMTYGVWFVGDGKVWIDDVNVEMESPR